MKFIFLAVCAGSLSLAACNNETKDSVEKADSINQARIDSPGIHQPVATDDESASFLVKASNEQMTQMQLGALAEQKGKDPKIKSLAAMMIHDHSGLNEEIKTLAARRNVILPDSVSEESRKKINDLAKKSSGSFDKAYTGALIKEHEASIDLFEKAADKVNDTEIKDFINNTLVKTKQHLDSVKAILKSVK